MLGVELISKIIAFIILSCICILVYPVYLILEGLTRLCRGILFIFKLPDISDIWEFLKNNNLTIYRPKK